MRREAWEKKTKRILRRSPEAAFWGLLAGIGFHSLVRWDDALESIPTLVALGGAFLYTGYKTWKGSYISLTNYTLQVGDSEPVALASIQAWCQIGESVALKIGERRHFLSLSPLRDEDRSRVIHTLMGAPNDYLQQRALKTFLERKILWGRFQTLGLLAVVALLVWVQFFA